jgi:hypothetical protein
MVAMTEMLAQARRIIPMADSKMLREGRLSIPAALAACLAESIFFSSKRPGSQKLTGL